MRSGRDLSLNAITHPSSCSVPPSLLCLLPIPNARNFPSASSVSIDTLHPISQFRGDILAMTGQRKKVKKLKRVSDIISTQCVQTSSSLQTNPQPSTPTKKDTRGWKWNSPRRSQTQATGMTTQMLPGLFSSLISALSPSRNSPLAHTALNAVAPKTHTSVPMYQPPAFDYHPDPSPTNNGDSIACELEDEVEPDDQDGVKGNYHHVSPSY